MSVLRVAAITSMNVWQLVGVLGRVEANSMSVNNPAAF